MSTVRALPLLLLLLAVPAAGQDDPAARIAELEAEVERLRETVGNLRDRLAEKPLDESGAQLLQNRIRNLILENNQFRRERDVCRGDLRAAERRADTAERRIADADRRVSALESDLRRAERDERRAASRVRSLESRLRRCR